MLSWTYVFILCEILAQFIQINCNPTTKLNIELVLEQDYNEMRDYCENEYNIGPELSKHDFKESMSTSVYRHYCLHINHRVPNDYLFVVNWNDWKAKTKVQESFKQSGELSNLVILHEALDFWLSVLLDNQKQKKEKNSKQTYTLDLRPNVIKKRKTAFGCGLPGCFTGESGQKHKEMSIPGLVKLIEGAWRRVNVMNKEVEHLEDFLADYEWEKKNREHCAENLNSRRTEIDAKYQKNFVDKVVKEMLDYCKRVNPSTNIAPMNVDPNRPKLTSIYQHYCLHLHTITSGHNIGMFVKTPLEWKALEESRKKTHSQNDMESLAKMKKLQGILDMWLFNLYSRHQVQKGNILTNFHHFHVRPIVHKKLNSGTSIMSTSELVDEFNRIWSKLNADESSISDFSEQFDWKNEQECEADIRQNPDEEFGNVYPGDEESPKDKNIPEAEAHEMEAENDVF